MKLDIEREEYFRVKLNLHDLVQEKVDQMRANGILKAGDMVDYDGNFSEHEITLYWKRSNKCVPSSSSQSQDG